MRLEAGDLQWCYRFEEADDVCLAAARLEPRHAGYRRLCLPFDRGVEPVQDRRHVASPERLVNGPDRIDVAHSLSLALRSLTVCEYSSRRIRVNKCRSRRLTIAAQIKPEFSASNHDWLVTEPEHHRLQTRCEQDREGCCCERNGSAVECRKARTGLPHQWQSSGVFPSARMCRSENARATRPAGLRRRLIPRPPLDGEGQGPVPGAKSEQG